jgi:uncharacterized protein YecT (DUF1311 family)
MTQFTYIQRWVLTVALGGAFGAGLLSIPVFAQTSCNNPQTQAQMNYCASLAAKDSDKKLNQVYRQLKFSLSDTKQKQRLIEAQRAWLKFRDAQCAYEQGFYSGGSIAPTIYYSCLAEVTEQRTKQLQSDLDEFQNR